MSGEDVTVSLSRLVLAKAIKTPDAGEEQEHWSKSVIFHQAHIDDQMRYSIQHPQHLNKRSKPGRPSKQPIRYPQNNHLVAPPMHRARSDEGHVKSPPMPAPSLSSSRNRSLPKSSAQSTHSVDNRSFVSVNKLANHSKQGRRYAPSDDEEEEEDEDEEEDEEEEDEEEEEMAVKSTLPLPQSTLPQMNTSPSPLPQKSLEPSKKTTTRTIQPSDDEEEEEEDEDEEESEDDEEDKKDVKQDEKDSEETDQLFARRMSTLRQLERGGSLHKKSHSTGSMMMLPPAEAFVEPTTSLMDPNVTMQNAALHATPETPGKLGTIEQWRVTVMEADDMSQSASTPVSTDSFNSPAETAEDDESLVEEPIVRSINASSSNLSTMRSQPLPNNPRASTMGDLEMMYYQQQQQQQQMYNMQMQQAMQLQQAHQMVQMQQYQQALQMQQQQMYAYNNSTTSINSKSNNRKSVSAMDLMMQLEQEKAATRKNNKKKMPDPSKANLNEGLLSHVPKHGQHNINFQQQVRKMQQNMPRASISDYHLQQLQHQQQQQQQQKSRPSSSMNIYNMQHASQSSMLKMPRGGGELSPVPTMSTSTPLNQQQTYFIPQQQSMLMPPQQMPMMDSNRSSQYLPNSKRQSTMNKF